MLEREVKKENGGRQMDETREAAKHRRRRRKRSMREEIAGYEQGNGVSMRSVEQVRCEVTVK